MMPIIRESILAVSSSFSASLVAKVTVVTTLGLIAAWLARGNRAAVRHALLASAFAVILLLPIVSVLTPQVHISFPMMAEASASAWSHPLQAGGAPAAPAPVAKDIGVRVILVQPPSSKIPWSSLLLAAWILGGIISLLPLAIVPWQIRLLRRSGLPWRRGQSLADEIALNAGIRRSIEVLLHEGVPGPMTCGIMHPAVILPGDAENWDGEDLTRAIVHELEHVRRCDSVSRGLARVACALYWFHPLVWMAWRRLVLESERSCDDAVLRLWEATAYADQLVGLAKRLSVIHRSPVLAMAGRAGLATRVGAVLDARQRRGRAGLRALALSCAAAFVLLIAMSAFTVVAAPQPKAPAQSSFPLRLNADFPNPVAPRLAAQVKMAQVQMTQAQPAPARPAPPPAVPAPPAQALQLPPTSASSRLLVLFFDLNSLDAESLMRAREQAINLAQTQLDPKDRISVMTYGSKLSVLSDFSNDQDGLLAALRTISAADAAAATAGKPAAGPEFDIFTVDRQLAALVDAIRMLGVLSEKKRLVYFSNGIPRVSGIDNQAERRAVINAAERANVVIWPVDARGLATEPRIPAR